MKEITIQKNDAGQRLDKFLTKAVKGLPMSLLYKSVRTKKIKVNRKRCQPNDMLKEGDVIQLFLKDEFFASPEEDKPALHTLQHKLNIVYEDENILLLHKRPGVLVHSDQEGGENTLLLHLQAYLTQKGEYNPENEQSFAPALCNRIDRNTGGIVIAAKNAEALRDMNTVIRENLVHKKYFCLVHGTPSPKVATLHGYLKKDAKTNMVTISDTPKKDYKEIITKYKVLESKGAVSLCEVELVTGRTHQIRASMAHIGHPLVGDGKYGINRSDKEKGYKFQALYAYSLTFDEKEDIGVLSYLKGKTFRLAEDEIWFIRDFREGKW